MFPSTLSPDPPWCHQAKLGALSVQDRGPPSPAAGIGVGGRGGEPPPRAGPGMGMGPAVAGGHRDVPQERAEGGQRGCGDSGPLEHRGPCLGSPGDAGGLGASLHGVALPGSARAFQPRARLGLVAVTMSGGARPSRAKISPLGRAEAGGFVCPPGAGWEAHGHGPGHVPQPRPCHGPTSPCAFPACPAGTGDTGCSRQGHRWGFGSPNQGALGLSLGFCPCPT